MLLGLEDVGNVLQRLACVRTKTGQLWAYVHRQRSAIDASSKASASVATRSPAGRA